VPASKLRNFLAAKLAREQKWPARLSTTFGEIVDCELCFGMHTWGTTVNKPQDRVQDLRQNLAKPSTRFSDRPGTGLNPIDVAGGNLLLEPRKSLERLLDKATDFSVRHLAGDSLGDSPSPPRPSG